MRQEAADRMREKVLEKVTGVQLPLRQVYEEVAEECGVEWEEVRSVVRQLRRQGRVETFKGVKHYWISLPDQPAPSTPRPRAEPAAGGPVEFVPGTDLRSLTSNSRERKALFRAFEKHRTGKAGALTLVNGHRVEKAWDEPDWDGAKAWIAGRTEVSRKQALIGLWRKFGVPTEWVQAELKRQGFIGRKQGFKFVEWTRDPAQARAEGAKHLRLAAQLLTAAGYDCAQVQTMLEEVWD